MGYGKAEALLYFQHPYRFNLLGQSRWLGRIYGELTTAVLSRRPVIYFGAFGRGLFQSMYEAPSSLLSYLPFTLEWNAIGILLFLAGLVSPRILPIAALPLAVSVAWAIGTAATARIDPRFSGVRARALVALLTYLGPLVRGLQRYLWRLRGVTVIEQVHAVGTRPSPRVDLPAADVRAAVLEREVPREGGVSRRRDGLPHSAEVPHRGRSGLEPVGPGDLPRHLVEGAGDRGEREPWRHEAPPERAVADPRDPRGPAQSGAVRRPHRGGGPSSRFRR